MSLTGREILAKAPVVPVIVIDDVDDAVPLAQALVAGGIPVLEVTLRTANGLDAIKAMVDAVPDAIVGAGTVTSTRELDKALAAGSQFIITPGQTPSLLKAGAECGVPYMPGTATVSELMCCIEQGLDTVKFFPAEASGGAKALAAFGGPFPDIKFCPTGGVNLDNLADYLAVKSVMTVGGSWIAPSALVAAKDWQGITALAQAATDKVAEIRAQLG